jgi:hypothetical protein
VSTERRVIAIGPDELVSTERDQHARQSLYSNRQYSVRGSLTLVALQELAAVGADKWLGGVGKSGSHVRI